MNLQPVNASASPEVQVNENFEVLDWATVYAKNPVATSGQTWGYFGGRWGGFPVAAGTLTLTDATTNYIVVERATGAISVSTSNAHWNDVATYAHVYKLTTVSGAVAVIEDHRNGPGGALSGVGTPGAVGPAGATGPTGAAGAAGAVGAAGATGAAGANGVAMALAFTSDTGAQADSDPGNGLFRWNNATQASATALYFDNLTQDTVSVATFWAGLASGGYIYLVQSDDTTKWQLWKWTATPVDGTGYYKFTVTLQASGGAIANGKVVYALFMGAGGGGGGGGTDPGTIALFNRIYLGV